jgi:hypothetical protein
MKKRMNSRLSAALVAGALSLAPVAGVVALAPAASAATIVVAENDPTPAGDGQVIHNPDGEDIMPIDAPIEIPGDNLTPDGDGLVIENPTGEDIVPINQPIEPISAHVANPWPGRILSGVLGLALGSLLGHLFHKQRYTQFESRV